jgi:hypothetical protein
MSKLIFHIGSPKTGTTAIQDILADYSEIFNNKFEYPTIGRNKGGGQIGFRRSLLQNANAQDLEWRNSYQKYFNDCIDNNTNILISSEQLWTVNPQRILQVFPQLANFDTYIIVCLREQSSMIHSHFKQKLKAGLNYHNLNQFFLEFEHHYNYFEVLKSWDLALKPKNIATLIYEYEKASLISSFFDAVSFLLGLQPAELNNNISAVKNKKSNQSLDESLLLIFSAINSSEYNDSLKKDMRNFLIKNSQKSPNVDIINFSFINEDLIKSIKKHYLSSNFALKEKYISDNSIPSSVWV